MQLSALAFCWLVGGSMKGSCGRLFQFLTLTDAYRWRGVAPECQPSVDDDDSNRILS